MIKNLIQSTARGFGYEIRKLPKPFSNSVDCTEPRRSLAESYAHIHRLGINPDIIIDVGIATGTPELYEKFPESYLLLIEPLPEFEATLRNILKTRAGAYVLAVAGDKEGVVRFNRHESHLDGSSLLKESMGAGADGEEIVVAMVKIDDVFRKKGLSGSTLVKIDVQGAELLVLAGARETLRKTEAVVLEVSLFEFMQGAPVFHDVIAYMKNLGFVAYDIIPAWNRPLDNAQGQLDILFVPENSRLRSNHSFSTFEQRDQIFKKETVTKTV